MQSHDIPDEKLRAILNHFDIDGFMEVTGCQDRQIAIVAIHKCRVIRTDIIRKKRRESENWLKANGMFPGLDPASFAPEDAEALGLGEDL